jgi:hypothetical protein
VNIDQLAPDEPLSPKLVCGVQAWKDYPWLHRAFKEIGPGAIAASDGWRVRIEDGLKTTLDFRVRPDGTAAVWCGMSGYDFHHDPTPKELLDGLAEAYRRELKRVGGSHPSRTGTWKMSAGGPPEPHPQPLARLAPPERPKPPPPVRPLPPAKDSLTRTLGAVLLPRAAQHTLIFAAVTALTLVLSAIANALR